VRANHSTHSNNREILKEGKEKNRIESRMTKGSPDNKKRPASSPPGPKVIWLHWVARPATFDKTSFLNGKKK
jgi:hypothetical protein